MNYAERIEAETSIFYKKNEYVLTYDFELTRKSTQSLCASNLSKPENVFLAHFSPKLSGKCHMHHRYNPW